MEKVTRTVRDNSLQTTEPRHLDSSILSMTWNRYPAYIQASVSTILSQEGRTSSSLKAFMPSKFCAPQAARQPGFLQGREEQSLMLSKGMVRKQGAGSRMGQGSSLVSLPHPSC